MFGILEGIAISAGSRVIGGIILDAFRKTSLKSAYSDFDIDRFVEGGQSYVGIRNTGNKSIDGCLIYSGGQPCRWWDNYVAQPRIISSGRGGNVIVKEVESNPLIEVASREKTLRKIRFLEITQRS